MGIMISSSLWFMQIYIINHIRTLKPGSDKFQSRKIELYPQQPLVASLSNILRLVVL